MAQSLMCSDSTAGGEGGEGDCHFKRRWLLLELLQLLQQITHLLTTTTSSSFA